MKNKDNQKKTSRHSFSYKNKSLFLNLIIVGILFLALIMHNSNIALLNIFFITYLFVGILQLPDKKDIKLSAKRTVNKTKNGNFFFVDVTLNITNNGNKNICIMISESLHKEIKIIEGSLKLSTALTPDEQIDLSYTFQSLRGGYEWNDLTVKVSDPFECIISKINIEANACVLIQPQYKKYFPFKIRLWKTLSSPGCVPTRTSGNGTDFRGIRDYHPGDPLKTLDWRLTARHPYKFFTREFEQERTADIAFIIDGRSNMELIVEDKSLFEIEINYTASLSDMFLHQGHRVGLSVVGENIVKVLPGYGKKQLHRILNCLALAKAADEKTCNRLQNLSAEQFSSKTIIFVLSPFDYNDITFYRVLRSHGFQVVLICPDTFDFALQGSNYDKNINMALRAAKIERKLNLSFLYQLSILVIDWKVSQPLIPLIKNALSKSLLIRKL